MLFGTKIADSVVKPTKIFYSVTREGDREDAGVDTLESAGERLAAFAEKMKTGEVRAMFVQYSAQEHKLEITYFPKR